MKKLTILLLAALASGSVMAHSHMPQKFGGKAKPNEAVTFTGVRYVPIIVGNVNKLPSKYEISVNGLLISETGLIGNNRTEIVHVPVKLREQGVVEAFKICSTSIAEPNKSGYRTRICTKAKLLWAKRK